jgi:outer membrane receptor protein involved in Fe transport
MLASASVLKSTHVLPAVCLFLVGSAASLAQTTGEIEGRVSDESDARLAGVVIEATSLNLQGIRAAVSGPDGSYRLPALPPGAYRVRAALAVWKAEERTATVSLGATTTVDFRLHLSTREKVIVSGVAAPVDLTSTETGTNYTSDVISKLPVARDYADIVRADPGVRIDRGNTQGRGIAVAVYGATSAENQWIIDGINTTNVMRGIQGKVINNEFVEEVEIKSGGYQAEYGRALGGIINAVTKSGGNEFHGDAFLYYDSDGMNAEEELEDQDVVANRMRFSDYERADFGLDLGGYFVKDRLWFFGAYNRIDFSARVSRYVSAPLVPNTRSFPLDGTDNLYSGKLTWNVVTGSTVVATVFGDPSTNSGAGSADPRQGQANIRLITNPDPATWESTRSIGGTDIGTRWDQLFGAAAMLTAQISRHRDRYELEYSGPAAAPRIEDFTCEDGTPEEPCRPPDSPNSVTGGFGFVSGAGNRSRSHRNQYDVDLSLYSGDHEVKLGGDFEDAATEAISYYTGGQVVYRLNEFGQTYYVHQFFASSRMDSVPVDSVRKGETSNVGLHVQDSWKVAPGWTVNAGLRWDQQDVRNYRDETVLKTTNEWQPRLGVVWDPKGDGRTKLHGFVGRFYYALPTVSVVRSFSNVTDGLTFNFDPATLVHDPSVIGHEESYFAGSTLHTPVDSGLQGGYQDELTVGVEKLLDPTFSIGLKGTYRRLGRVIEDRCDLDYSAPVNNGSSCGIFNPGSRGPIGRGDVPGCNGRDFPECTETIPATPPARRVFRGIELLVRKSFRQQVWLQLSYLYSSLRGNYDGGVTAGGQTDPGITLAFDYPDMSRNAYGRVYLDRPHDFRVNGFYVTPLKLSVGFQAFVQSGAPLNRIGYFSDWQGAAVHLVKQGTAGRLPTLWGANLTLGYPLRLGPVQVSVQAYVYNLFKNRFVTGRDEVWSDTRTDDYPKSLFDPNQPRTNPNYGKVTGRQETRLVRGAMRISF